MLKKYLINMCLSALFLFIFSIRFVDVTIGEKIFEYPLETAWKVTGLPLNQVYIEAWMKINDQWLTGADIKRMASETAQKLNLVKAPKLTFGEQTGYSFASFEGIQADGTVITVTLQSTNTGANYETQMGIITAHDGRIKDLRYYIVSLKRTITRLNPKREIRFCIEFQGRRPGKISPLLIKDISGKAFRKINAELIDSGFVDGNSSQKGYTHLLKEAVTLDFKRVNIEICTRYDETRNLTEIIMATPNSTDGV